jgi:hypothetical protein
LGLIWLRRLPNPADDRWREIRITAVDRDQFQVPLCIAAASEQRGPSVSEARTDHGDARFLEGHASDAR